MRRLMSVAVVGLLAVGAPSAGAATKPPVLNPVKTKERSFTVNCTSTGLPCDPPYAFLLRIPDGYRVTRMTYVASPVHCSQVRVRIFVNGADRGISRPIGPGQEHSIGLRRLAGGKTHGIRIRGVGVVGGCNAGYTGSWGGKVKFAVERR